MQSNDLMKRSIIDKVYPVGAIYMTTSDVNPSELFGGTWQRFAEGRTIIGVGTSDKVFNIGDTGGESKHVLSIEEMPYHNHEIEPHTHECDKTDYSFWFSQFQHSTHEIDSEFPNCFNNSDNINVKCEQKADHPDAAPIGSGENWGYRKLQVSWRYKPELKKAATAIMPEGKGWAHNNLPPYVVTYIWCRIS